MSYKTSYNELGLVDPTELSELKEYAEKHNVVVKIRDSKDGSAELLGDGEKVRWIPRHIAPELVGKPAGDEIKRSEETWGDYRKKTELSYKYHTDPEYKKYVQEVAREKNAHYATKDINIGAPDEVRGRMAIYKTTVLQLNKLGEPERQKENFEVVIPLRHLTPTPDGNYIQRFSLYNNISESIKRNFEREYHSHGFVLTEEFKNSPHAVKGIRNEISMKVLFPEPNTGLNRQYHITSPTMEMDKEQVHAQFLEKQQRLEHTIARRREMARARSI